MELRNITVEENEKLKTELVQLARNNISKRKLRTFLIALLLLSLTFLMAWFYGRNAANKHAKEELENANAQILQLENEIQDMIENPVILEPVAPEIDLDLLRSEIVNIGELATVEYLFTDAARFSDTRQIKNWSIPFTEKSFTLKWDGVIKVGVILEKVSFNVNEDDKIITVTIPEAQILSYEIDESSVEILDEKDNIFNSISVDDKIAFDESTKAAMIERAIENGILDKAQKNAQVIIKNIICVDPAIEGQYAVEFLTAGE